MKVIARIVDTRLMVENIYLLDVSNSFPEIKKTNC